MATSPLILCLLTQIFGICRLPGDAPIPPWALQDAFFSITRTKDELSVVCRQDLIPPEVKCESHWRCLQVLGPLDFSLTGILAGLASVLARDGISIFAISTYDTDYIFVKSENLDRAVSALSRAGKFLARQKKSGEV